jgi:hypothetical protein
MRSRRRTEMATIMGALIVTIFLALALLEWAAMGM